MNAAPAVTVQHLVKKYGHREETVGEDGEAAEEKPASGRRGQRPGRSGHGRRRYEHLPVDDEVVEPDASQLNCERCGRPLEPFGEDSSEQIDWEVVVRRVRHRRSPTYRM